MQNLPLSDQLIKSFHQDLDYISSLSRKSFPNVTSTCHFIKTKLSPSFLQLAIKKQTPLDFEELSQLFTLCSNTNNQKIIETCLNLYQSILAKGLLSHKVIVELESELNKISLTPTISVRLLQLILHASSANYLHGHTLCGYMNICFRLLESNDINVSDTAKLTITQVCISLLDNLAMALREKLLSEFDEAVVDIIPLIKDICLLIQGEMPTWLTVSSGYSQMFLISLLCQLIKTHSELFLNVPELLKILQNDIINSTTKLIMLNIRLLADSNELIPIFPMFPNHSQLTITVDRKAIINFVEILKFVYIINTLYFSALQTECITILNALCKLIQPHYPLWIRVTVLQIFYDLIKESKIFSFVMDEAGKSMIINITTYCFINMAADFDSDNDLASPSVRLRSTASSNSNKEYLKIFEKEVSYWDIFINILVRPKHCLWDDLERIDVGSITYDHLTCYGSLILLSIPRIIFNCMNGSKKDGNFINVKTGFSEFERLLSLIYPTISCLLHKCVSTNPSVYDSILEAITVGALVSNMIDISPPKNLFLSCLWDYCSLSDIKLFKEKTYVYTKHTALFFALCDLVRYHHENMGEYFWKYTFNSLMEFSCCLQWPSSTIIYLYINSSTKNNLSLGWNLECMESFDKVIKYYQQDNDVNFKYIVKLNDSRQNSSTLMEPKLFDSISSIFKETKSICEASFIDICSSFNQLFKEFVPKNSENLDSQRIYEFFIGRLFDIGIQNMSERSGLVFEHITSTLVQVCFLPVESVRCYSTQYCIFLIKYCLKLHLNKKSIELCVDLFKKLAKIQYHDCKQFIFYSIYGFITDYKENIEDSWDALIDTCSSMLIAIDNSSLSDTDSFSVKEYMSRRMLSIIQLIVDQCLKFISIAGIIGLIKFMDKFAMFTDNVNYSLIVTGYLITISDHMCGKFLAETPTTVDSNSREFWNIFFKTLCNISSDSRSTLRKSAVQTLFNVIEVRGTFLTMNIMQELLGDELFPLITKTASMVRDFSSEEVELTETGKKNKTSFSKDLLQVHHSRNTPQKQWMETLSLLINGISKLYVQYIQNMHNKNKCELNDCWFIFFKFITNSIINPNIELSFTATLCFLNMLSPCNEYSSRNKNTLSSQCYLWKISLNTIRKFYDWAIFQELSSDSHVLDRVKEQYSLISRICSVSFPYVIHEITENDIDVWFKFFDVLIKIELSRVQVLNYNASSIPRSNTHDNNNTQQKLFISFIRCKCSCLEHSTISSIVMYFMGKLLSFTKHLSSNDIYFEAILQETTLFYSENISKYPSFVEYYKDFIQLWEGPMSSKYSYISPFLWRKCLWSFYIVTEPSLKPYFATTLDNSPIIHLVEILQSFLFCDSEAPSNITPAIFQQDNDKDSELINFISTTFISNLPSSAQDILHAIVSLMLKGFVSVSTVPSKAKKSETYKNINLRQEFNDACTASLINLSLGCIYENTYKPPVYRIAELALETLSKCCSNLIANLSKIEAEAQNTQLIVEAASALKASKAVYSRANLILSSPDFISKLDTDFLVFLNHQLISLYDTCVNSITLKKSSLRILAQEALQEFRCIIFNQMTS